MPKKRVKKPRSKSARVVGAYRTDVSLALTWLDNNKVLKSPGKIEKVGDRYVSNIKIKSNSSKSKAAELVSAKFGRFVRVV
jgi:hypothetical protein